MWHLREVLEEKDGERHGPDNEADGDLAVFDDFTIFLLRILVIYPVLLGIHCRVTDGRSCSSNGCS